MLVRARPRLSLNVTFTLSAPLAAQAQAHADAHKQPLSFTLRDAVYEFLHAPHRYTQPNIAALVRANLHNPAVTGMRRDRQLGFVLPNEDTHTELHVYAQGLLLTRAAIIRRAVYEYTKAHHAPSSLPEIIIDAWGDRPMNPPEKRQKRKRRTATPNNVRSTHASTLGQPTKKFNYIPNLTADEDAFNKEFGQWLK